jgi:hypothetical protein
MERLLSAFILGHRYLDVRLLEGVSCLTQGRGGHLPFGCVIPHFLLLLRLLTAQFFESRVGVSRELEA